MIDYIRGRVEELQPTTAVVEAHGVGYAMQITLTTYDVLKHAEGDEVKLYVLESIREDAYILFGFSSIDERTTFASLLTVPGVGGNTARTILSAFTPSDFRTLVASEDARTLKSVKGIGLKTAQRIIVDLKDKLAAAGDISTEGPESLNGQRRQSADEAVAALATLGYPPAAAAKAVAEAIKGYDGIPAVEEIIKQALKIL